MRLLSWNINGIRTLPQYHPWNTHKTGDAILTALEADIICFQEMKIQRNALEKHIAVPEHFDSFFSFPVTKGGYSGVAIFTNTKTAAPLKAEEGLTGTLHPKPPLSTAERVSPSYPQAHEMTLFPDENDHTPSSLAPLDAEGRALVLDFGLFVLINVYCPAETSDTRLPYKMNFHLMLEERVRKLIHDEHREVIVLGDINITAAPIDHCDGHLPSHQANFWDHPPRALFKKWLAPSGPMVDVIRDIWPDRKGMYTCWNTKISARESNYGTRLDHILLTRGLLPWFKHGDIQPSVRGSDHCPVYVDLHDEIRLDSGQVVQLREVMKYEEAKRNPPRVSARFWREFSGEQRLLSTFFARKNAKSVELVVSSDVVPSREAPAPDVSSQESAMHRSSSQPDDAISADEPSSQGSSKAPGCSSTVPPPPEHQVSSSQKKRPTDEDRTSQPKKKKQKTGQTKLSAFFAKPQPAAASSSQDAELASESDERDVENNLARSLSDNFQPDVPRLSSSSSSLQSKAAWTHLLAPLQPPKCKVHEEPCKELTVNKPGPNKGKTFFLCSRPVGPGYDKGPSRRPREEVDGQYQCNFFKWASDVKRESLKGSGSKGVLSAVAGQSDPPALRR